MFHGARVTDVHAAALALQKVIDTDQVLIGVGYSMGAIVLSNYVASSGIDCALDGAISISGGLDMRFQEHFGRAQRLWQPMLAETLRSDFLLGKWGIRVHERLSKYEMLRMMRATHITVRYCIPAHPNHVATTLYSLDSFPKSQRSPPPPTICHLI